MTCFESLREKAKWVWAETLKLHSRAAETRIASSLSDVEIFTALYYGGILKFDPRQPDWAARDRLIVSKGHGAVSLYPILADLTFFDKAELEKIGKEESPLCVIPDNGVPGIETINGSLGHGLGVACGIALALKRKNKESRVFVVCGDGELNEGSMWEAIMFAAFHKLSNLILIVDNNKMSMLGYQDTILGLEPVEEKFRAFGWRFKNADGHSLEQLCAALRDFKNEQDDAPAVLIAETFKGKGVSKLENDPLCHVKSLTKDEINGLLEERQ